MSTTSEATLQFLDAGDEADLTARAQMGNRDAFLELARHYQRPLYRLLFALCLDEERAAAHTTEALVRASEKMCEYPSGRRFFPWLVRIARSVPTPPARSVPPPAAAPGATHEVDDRLLAAIEALRMDDRMTLALRVIEQLRYEAIAAILYIPVGVAMLRIAQARGHLVAATDVAQAGAR
jgi:DNA-directed RNA polymerase specialized sigma24 family protein